MTGPMARAALLLAIVTTVAAAPGTTDPASANYYGQADFTRVEKIDAHVHVHGVADRFMAQAEADHFRILNINVDYPDFPSIREQQHDAASLRQRYPGRAAFAGTFSVANFLSPAWSISALHEVDAAVAQGAVGIKIWKNIGMALRDADGGFVMPDDPRFEPIIERIEHD